jgi:hypothetical protein
MPLAPAAGDEHVLAAIFGEGLAGEAAIERFQFQTRDVEEPEPKPTSCRSALTRAERSTTT